MKGAKAGSVMMSVRRNLISSGFKKHIRAPKALLNDKVERKITLTEVMAKARDFPRVAALLISQTIP